MQAPRLYEFGTSVVLVLALTNVFRPDSIEKSLSREQALSHISRRVMPRHSTVDVIGCVLIVGSIPLLWQLSGSLISRIMTAPTDVKIALFYLPLINTAFTMVLFAWALGRIEATRASSFVFFVPVLALIWAWLILDEPVTAWLAVGTVVLLGGVWLVQQKRQPKLFPSGRSG